MASSIELLSISLQKNGNTEFGFLYSDAKCRDGNTASGYEFKTESPGVEDVSHRCLKSFEILLIYIISTNRLSQCMYTYLLGFGSADSSYHSGLL